MAKKENHMGFMSKLLSFGSDKDLKRYYKIVDQINGLEPQFEKMTEEELRGQTDKFRERYANGESLDDMLPEAFATVREASKRTMGMRHFDVQLIGAMALHEGHIAEMKTGEGKTLVSTLAGYLNAIAGKGVHVVTVNDYLAKRDSEWMGRIYKYLGMTVGLLQNNMPLELKRPAYQADVTYGTNSEFGFDYLRDNMVTRPEQRVQRGHNYAIVDEVDSILIDEARTPLIISGAGTKSASTYKDFARAVRGLERGEDVSHDMLTATEDVEPTGDYVMDEAKHTIAATERGLKKIERRLGIDDIYADLSGQLVNHLQQALKAQYMFHRDKQYVVTNGEVKIVDEFTGRIMEGRRYSEGLHQAIEAKEGVLVREENQTLATITLQNYFRLYDKLSGMTGTALTEDAEFREIYKLPVEVIPSNKPVQRVDHEDLVYRTIQAKYNAVADDVERRHAKGQPVLVGTVSIESSEKLSAALTKRGIAHEVLNAKHHEREAHIVAQAGRYGAVTIATNMAGRGTDILLGGNPDELVRERLEYEGLTMEDVTPEQLEQFNAEAKETCKAERERVLAAGGLTVIGTERHESRRIDNQLRGRSGRQGDPGETQFYLSLEDDLMRLFGGDKMDRVSKMMVTADMGDDMPIQHKIISKAVESAQHKVESINFSMRKSVLEYDDVMNKQRQVIYAERNKILDGKDLTGWATDMFMSAKNQRQKNEGRAVNIRFRPGTPVELFTGRGAERRTMQVDPQTLVQAVIDAQKRNRDAEKTLDTASVELVSKTVEESWPQIERMQGRFTEYQRAGTYKPSVAMKWARRLVDRTAGEDEGRWTNRQRRQAARLLIQELTGTQDPTQARSKTTDRPTVEQYVPEGGKTPDAIGDETPAPPRKTETDMATKQRQGPIVPASQSPAAGPERRHTDLKSTLDRFRTRLKKNLDGLNADPPTAGTDRNRGQRKTL